MEYTFDILGVSPVLYFFNQQQEIIQKNPQPSVEYIGTYKCTLDAFLDNIERVTPKRGWNFDEIANTVLNFWLNHSDNIRYWQSRLTDAGKENLLVSRVADIQGLQEEFEFLLGKGF